MKLSGLDWDELQASVLNLQGAGRRPSGSPRLSREEATRRARKMLARIVARDIGPSTFTIGLESKSVLNAMVYGLLRDGTGAERRHALVVHDFIRDVRWFDDVFGMKQELLRECAAAGREPSGQIEIEDVSSSRHRPVMPAPEPPGASERELRAIFEEHRPLIHSVFVDRFGLREAEAETFERDLLKWFLRACRRSRPLPRNLRALLLSASDAIGRAGKGFPADCFPESESQGS